MVIGKFCILCIENHNNQNEYTIKLPYKFKQDFEAFVSVVDTDQTVSCSAYSNIKINWLSSIDYRTINYIGAGAGHMILIVGMLE